MRMFAEERSRCAMFAKTKPVVGTLMYPVESATVLTGLSIT